MKELLLINSAERLREIFDLANPDGVYHNYLPFPDRIAGFSIEREYPNKLRYKPLKTRDGKAVTVALYHVVYGHPKDTEQPINDAKVPVFISIGLFNRYKAAHHEYAFSDPDCPTEESIELSESSPKPASLESKNIFYDHKIEKLIIVSGQAVSGRKLLDSLFKNHCDTVRKWRGIKYRFNKKVHSAKIYICKQGERFCRCLLKCLGYALPEKVGFDIFSGSYTRKDLQACKSADITIFQYKTSKNVVVAFSIIVVIGFILYFLLGLKLPFVSGLATGSLFVMCSVIIFLWILESVIPRVLLIFVNYLFKKRIALMTRGFSV
jgi:hypothetical protein